MVQQSVSGEVKIPKRVLDTLLQALMSGVVPRAGAPYIAIGRNEEIATLLDDLSMVKEGSGTFRLVIGRYGSGKSFLLQLIRGYAMERGFLTADADLSPERRLCGGYGAATYRELMKNMASKYCPDGGAIATVLSRFYSQTKQSLAERGIMLSDPVFSLELRKHIYKTLSDLEENVGGFDFSSVLCTYYDACIADDESKKSAALRWLRGEYSTKTEAKNATGLPLSGIIADDNWYEYLKLWAVFAQRIGYVGFIVFIDECVNLYKIPNRISREANYEKILSMFNDTTQGKAPYFGVMLNGTPQFLEDPRRGLFSYEALKSRLADSVYQQRGFKDFSSPVIRLRILSDNELLALLSRLSKLWEQKYPGQRILDEEDLQLFLRQSLGRVGADEMMTPREIIRNYLSLLSALRDNPDVSVEELMDLSVNNRTQDGMQNEPDDPDDSFGDFCL